jgi:hypothetical protein
MENKTLKDVTGIGPRLVEALGELGVGSLEGLVEADAATLAEGLGRGQAEVEGWQAQARGWLPVRALRYVGDGTAQYVGGDFETRKLAPTRDLDEGDIERLGGKAAVDTLLKSGLYEVR